MSDDMLKDWKNINANEIFDIQGGYAFKSDDTTAEGARWLKIANVGIGKVLWDEESFLPFNYLNEYKIFCLRNGDLVVAMTRPLLNSKLKIAKITDSDTPCLLNQRVGRIVRQECIFSDYLFHILRTEKIAYQLESDLRGTDPPNLSIKTFNGIKILLPPLPEQIAIADLLSTWDEAIEKTDRLIATKKRRLLAYSQLLFDRAQIGKKNGWKVIKLKNILAEHGDKSTGKEKVFSVSVHKGLVNQTKHLGRSFSAANTDNYNLVHYGDIVYTKSPTGDFPYGIVKQSTIDDVIVSPLYGVFSPQTIELGTILDFYFESPLNARNYLHPITQKGAKNTINITNKIFLSAKLHLPLSPKEQKSISKFVVTTRQEIDLLKKQANAFRKQKRGLMQKLLTGQWRVKVAQ